MTTEPGTDLWQRTYYHFRNDNAPALQLEIVEPFFSFVVRADFSGTHHRLARCGVVMYLDSENWLKGSVEDSSFTARFTDLALGACAWQAHDGQQPDEE